MDAQEYDPRPAMRRKRLVAAWALMAVAGFIVWLSFRHSPEKHAVDRFFHAIEAGNLEQAYALYTGDATWQEHPGDHQNYTLEQFRLDWVLAVITARSRVITLNVLLIHRRKVPDRRAE